MRVTFDHQVPVAHNIISFYFKPERKVRYQAGQFIELSLPHHNPDNRGQKHWFTLSSSPSEELLTITTKFPIEGQTSTFKQTLKALKPGQEVMMSDPMGDFVLPKDKTIPLAFVAGGIGVTPMRSMVKWLTDEHEERPIHLIYAANSQEEVAFEPLFKDYGLKLTEVLANPPKGWQGETGRLDAQRILDLTVKDDRQLYYISGPEPMVEGLVKDLEQAGISSKRLVGDYFPNYTNNV